jgi:hypothetical protein
MIPNTKTEILINGCSFLRHNSARIKVKNKGKINKIEIIGSHSKLTPTSKQKMKMPIKTPISLLT